MNTSPNTTSRWRAIVRLIRAELASILSEPTRATDAHPPDIRFSQSTWMR
ncbi:MAG TPA: hypothetical protein VNJ54_21260 [Plantibacter sp.]|nr:hypothetical protein [Plantibacter sp.]